MSRFQLIRQAREKVVAVKKEHQRWQPRRNREVPITVTVFTRRSA